MSVLRISCLQLFAGGEGSGGWNLYTRGRALLFAVGVGGGSKGAGRRGKGAGRQNRHETLRATLPLSAD